MGWNKKIQSRVIRGPDTVPSPRRSTANTTPLLTFGTISPSRYLCRLLRSGAIADNCWFALRLRRFSLPCYNTQRGSKTPLPSSPSPHYLVGHFGGEGLYSCTHTPRAFAHAAPLFHLSYATVSRFAACGGCCGGTRGGCAVTQPPSPPA